MLYYKLENQEVVECSLEEWMDCFAGDRLIAFNKINDVTVSTAFLGLDHTFIHIFMDGKPLVFETMIFGGKYDKDCSRYSTYKEAEIGHLKMVKKAMEPE